METTITSNFEMRAVEIFEAERNSVVHYHQDKPYSEAEMHKIEKMAEYIKSYVCLNPSHFKSYISMEEDIEEFRNEISQYEEVVRTYKEENLFPEPYFFVTPTSAYQYNYVEHADWIISPVYELDHYSLFFAFKLRNIPAQEIRSFLEYQQKLFDGDFLFFLKTLLAEHQEILPNAINAIVTIWSDMQEKLAKDKPASPIRRIQWKGTQKQLGELFVELKRKNWIEDPEYAAIKNCFTESNSIDQVLKPFQDKKTKVANFENIYTKDYTPFFSEIKLNPKT